MLPNMEEVLTIDLRLRIYEIYTIKGEIEV